MLLVGTALAALSLALPFVDFAAQGTVNGIDGYAWAPVALLVLPAAFTVLGDRAEGFATPLAIIAVAACGLAVVLAAFKLADAATASNVPDASLGIGPWVLAGASLVALAGAVLSMTQRI